MFIAFIYIVYQSHNQVPLVVQLQRLSFHPFRSHNRTTIRQPEVHN